MIVSRHSILNSTIRLQSDSFVITGVASTQPELLEFEVISNGVVFGNIGGQVKSIFTDEMLSILEKRNGRKPSSIPRAAFKDVVGGDDTEYLGKVALSGYNTLYFFEMSHD
jgi:hypothetical protein